jgi:cell division protein FtsQ
MDVVADLLGKARSEARDLYAGFRVVSLERLATDRVLLVRTESVDAVRFGTQEDFFRQLARLDLILEQVRGKNPGAKIKSVDLSVSGSQVPVLLDEGAVGPRGPGAQRPAERRQIFQP